MKVGLLHIAAVVWFSLIHHSDLKPTKKWVISSAKPSRWQWTKDGWRVHDGIAIDDLIWHDKHFTKSRLLDLAMMRCFMVTKAERSGFCNIMLLARGLGTCGSCWEARFLEISRRIWTFLVHTGLYKWKSQQNHNCSSLKSVQHSCFFR